jgi:hypothetical protein
MFLWLSINGIKMLNKKGQIGEQTEDVFSFIIIVLLLAILFLVTVVLHRNGLALNNEEVTDRILNDKTELMLNSIMREKQSDNTIFSDKIRLRDEDSMRRIDQKETIISNQVPGHLGFYLDLVYNNAEQECKKAPERMTKKSCFFIPGKPIGVKMISVWGYLTM